MSGRGRKAVLPPGGLDFPESAVADGLVVEHRNREGRVASYDFAVLPVAEPLQRSLAVLFAGQCRTGTWSTHGTSRTMWREIGRFTAFLSQQPDCPNDLDEVTAGLVSRWRLAKMAAPGGRAQVRNVSKLLRTDGRLQSGPVAELLARRVPALRGRVQSYDTAAFDHIVRTARQDFRAALMRIEDNARLLDQWQSGAIGPDDGRWSLGEALDFLARTGDVPRAADPRGRLCIPAKWRRALGGAATVTTWKRLFLSRPEAVSLGVLLLAEFGWNLSVIDRARVPRASPDPGQDGRPTYRLPVEKRRRGAGRWYETENVTDTGAGSPGRLITQALSATRFARAAVAAVDPEADVLLVSRTAKTTITNGDGDRRPPIGPFVFGIAHDDVRSWARRHNLAGSPFQRGRRTVVSRVHRGPLQHSQATHDRAYLLPDQQVQAEAPPPARPPGPGPVPSALCPRPTGRCGHGRWDTPGTSGRMRRSLRSRGARGWHRRRGSRLWLSGHPSDRFPGATGRPAPPRVHGRQRPAHPPRSRVAAAVGRTSRAP
ncbi:hypothetical protein [Streptomyces phaeochromogenes]|uniref:hypothetical protein n=1 Tax=Streptomyces phaeochromogenes TaxID=1923 RepID=UPI00386A1786|nr:hypothetical protein OG277_50140 [Streptomyces phaeochromogenes]